MSEMDDAFRNLFDKATLCRLECSARKHGEQNALVEAMGMIEGATEFIKRHAGWHAAAKAVYRMADDLAVTNLQSMEQNDGKTKRQ